VTLADLALAAPLMSLVPAKLPVTDCAHMLAWFERVQTLDAWKKTSL
jgi:glutathione S-transferase